MQEFIEIDANLGEAGGQVLRTALALSALLEKRVHIFNIRAGRKKPGLRPQHLTAVQALATICNAELEKAELNSSELFFSPKKISPQKLNINIGTAGSTSLLLQQLLPVALKTKLDLRIIGGTDVAFAPSIFYLKNILSPKLHSMGARFNLDLLSHGYFPRGKGRTCFKSSPAKLPLKPISLIETGELQSISCFSNSSSLPLEVAGNQAKKAKKILLESFPGAEWTENLESNTERKDTIGSAIDLFACFEKTVLGANALGEKGVPAAKVGAEAAQRLLQELALKKPVDSHCSDQLLLFMALAKGKSEIAVANFSSHCQTNISVIEKLLPVKFYVQGSLNSPARISVEGIAFK